MSLKDDIIRLGDENPDLVPDLLPVMVKATGAHCCRRAKPVPDHELRSALIKLAEQLPRGSLYRRLVLQVIQKGEAGRPERTPRPS